MRLGIANILKPYQKVYRKYMRVTLVYEEYTRYLPFKFYSLNARIKNKNRKIILSYPEKPLCCHTLYHICSFNGYKITNKPQQADVIINFEDVTLRKPNKVLNKLSLKSEIVNYRSLDISKDTVEKVHQKVFSYGASVNPRTFKGKYVKKSVINSLHNGVIRKHAEKPEKGYVYQILINNEFNGVLLEIRVPAFRSKITF